MFGFVSCSLSTSAMQIMLSLAALLLAYIMIVSFMGYYRAWIAHMMGDSSAVEAGFLTLNPRKQIGMQGLFSLLFFRFGWGATQPHKPTNITGPLDEGNPQSPQVVPHMWTKLFIAYLSSPFVHLAMAVIEMVILLGMFGEKIVLLADTAMLHGNLSHEVLSKMYPMYSGLTLFVAMVLMAAIYIHLFSSVFNFIFRGSKIFMIYLAEKSPRFAMYQNFAKIFLMVIVILFFLTPVLRYGLLRFISNISLFIFNLVNKA